MTTPWYYEFHEKGAFSHQQQLCDAVRWTEYNLEGQKLKSANVLSAIQGNPLTIRLLALNEALKHFENAKTIDEKIKGIARAQFEKNKFFAMSGTWIAENSSLNTKGAPIEIIDIAGERFEYRHIDIHLMLYEFFTNLGSILDRLAHEINMLYNLGIPQKERYWGTLIKDKPYLEKLRVKDGGLADLLKDYAGRFQAATRYRNRMVHDGIIKVESDISVSGLRVNLTQDPDNEASPMNVDAVSFCEETRVDVLKLLDRSYELILQHIKTQGKPPW